MAPEIQSNGSGHGHSRNTLAILGCGAMGTAILSGVLTAKASASEVNGSRPLPNHFIACVRREEAAAKIRSKLPPEALDSNVTVSVNDNVGAVRDAGVVLLACQPHLFKPILNEPGMTAALRGKPIISVLAGVTSDEIESHLEYSAVFVDYEENKSGDTRTKHEGAFSIIRVMPNIACAVQASSSVLETRPLRHPRPLPEGFVATAHAIFSCVGNVFVTQPDTFSICTTLNGSTPAFFAMVIDGLVDGAVALGLSRTEATRMAAATMRGTAELVLSGKATQDLRYEVACPGGATIQGLKALEEARTRAVWMDAMRAATSEQSALGAGLKVARKDV